MSSTITRRQLLGAAGAAAALAIDSRRALAEAYPVRPVRLVVPFAAGGPTDVVARLTGQWLSERLGQQFIIENRPGAGGSVGTEVVVRAPPDGYTLLQVGAFTVVNAALYDNLSFSFARDITPVASMFSTPLVMVANPSLPAKTIPEFIAYAKRQSRQDQYGVERNWRNAPRHRRTVQNDGWR
ncbi:tripartite tricarboxylate transporter family receptor [Variibacter gotjawalensis]|uniref:Tripartite tricarboxylate transporter family receptor n=1 Tax=Variibacter gotjawalensis TaxID=1333996 RepID=A0A0S3PU94_9BRAD|nr:tripartite tricarboxylate transporter substrate-binding protein [Variibacter gotjawalensis]NIK49707.1 tripartite-type tricarboxylate transporter receptor subunit TctC [Variibacter gotjawalensis]BAT59390.1 tripartite tricarboxylate transporter family receptor [Variibacter gotjawalensis]